jgi:hypothetical protein
MGRSDALWFAAPGLAHQLGNALFTLLGRARLLPAAGEPLRPDDRQAVLEGAERARSCLCVLRWLLDDDALDAAGSQPAAAVLAQVAEVLRVPLRDRGLTLELLPDVADCKDSVAAGPVARLLVAVCARLSALAVPGPGGTLRIGLQQPGAGSADFVFTMLPTPGGLPFPVDPGLVVEPLLAEVQQAGATPRPAPTPSSLALRVPATP